MNFSDILEILKYTIPSLVTLGGVYMLVRLFIDDENKRRNQETRKNVCYRMACITDIFIYRIFMDYTKHLE